MEIQTKIYLYDSTQENNGYKGTDYSSNLSQADVSVENLDDTIDTNELTLYGLSFRTEFEPKTKFIIEKYQRQTNSDNYIKVKEFDREVSHDSVEQPIMSDDTYFDHHISLSDASIEAQFRPVDNIAITYKLKDISLSSTPTYDTNAKININESNVNYSGNLNNFWNIWSSQSQNANNFNFIMPDYYTIGGKTPSWSDWTNFLLNQEIPEGQSTKSVSLPIPMLYCTCSTYQNGDKPIITINRGYCSIDAIVQETDVNGATTTLINRTINPASDIAIENGWNTNSYIGGDTLKKGAIESRAYRFVYKNPLVLSNTFYSLVSTFSQFNESDRVLNFDIKINCTYKIIIKRHKFSLQDARNIYPNTYGTDNYDEYPAYFNTSTSNYYVVITKANNNPQYINDNYPSVSTQFYSVLAGANETFFTKSANPATAYDLFNKSILTTQDFRKINGTIVDETPKPFYIGGINDLQNLKNATIIESLYNQNNLWQIFMEVGKYIHAKPYLTFGTDNRYLVNFNYYGRTDQNTDNTNRISVFNSKFVEEYISSCTSYITNMVQLGGTITEILAPKSTSSDYLVSNNTAELITNKNIIEIDDLQVIRKSDNEIRDLAGKGTHGESTNGYVFSKDIYNLLSVNANDSINKGLAIYYELGTNIVKGFNYQLPSINTGDAQTDYAIKRIIGTVFGIETSLWKDIKVNDYLFKIVYKTKDTLRQDQSRPDLRKFILATKYDRVPQHIQFNNQTDIVVDSARFGNNIYGKLIRTGNSIIQKGGWISDLNNLIRAGDLYYINDEPYYASKVKTTYFVDHAICDVEYSKDFNRLSQIIGIPSEPRFYEVATTNLSNREKNFNDYVLLGTTNENVSNAVDTYIQDNGWNYLNSLLFENGIDFPKYSVTYFKNDIDKATPVLGSGSFSTSVCLPISCYTSETTLTFEWDMQDNLSAGDQVIATTYGTGDNAYNTLKPVRYVDSFCRADMIDFAVIQNYNLTNEQIMQLPKNNIDLSSTSTAPYLFGNENLGEFGLNTKGNILLKDNREIIKCNYNIQLQLDSDRFVISSFLWQPNKISARVGLLKNEVNKISNSTIDNADFVYTDIPFTHTYDSTSKKITIDIASAIANYDLTGIKAIVVYCNNLVNDNINAGSKYFMFARNITNLSNENARLNWYISLYDKSLFKKQ
jgi:hypothetical protein